MPLNSTKPLRKSSCDKHTRNPPPRPKHNSPNMPRKLLISKKWHQNCSHDVKAKSTGIIHSQKQKEKSKKIHSSLPVVTKSSDLLDFCKLCGDADDIETAVSVFTRAVASSATSKTSGATSKNDKKDVTTDSTEVVKEYYRNEKFEESKSTINYTKSKKAIKINSKKDNKASKSKKAVEIQEEVVQEHYLNDKFADLYDSMHDFDPIVKNDQILDTIIEVTEQQASSSSKTALSRGKPSRESNVYIFEESDDRSSLKRLKEFRDKNYFECHSAKNRIESKSSAISLQDHKCTYRLYLNERLFPVAISNDHNNTIRCVDCHLPLESSREEDRVNGTIQAKVKLGSETQDMVLLLPIKEPLIIKQERKETVDNDVVYFGLVRMDQYGNSMFNPTTPSDSLALRYQKGFRQFNDAQSYRYDKLEESDVVYV